jgi:hypothetical protein
MRIIDKLYSLYIKNIILPGTEDFSTPGYIFTKLTNDPKQTILRDVFFPEDLIIELELKTVEKRSMEGRKCLYAIGKNCGYTYAKFSGMETIKTKPDKKDIEKYMRLILLFIAGTYGSDLAYELDVERKIHRFSFTEYVVCKKNGIGEIFFSGSATGIADWVQQDTQLEGTQIECIGRGDKRCTLLVALPEKIKELGYTAFEVPELLEVKMTEEYFQFNKPLPTKSVKSSLNELIANKIMTFDNLKLLFNNKRFFECDCHYVYILEHLYQDDETLFNVSFHFYKQLGEEIRDKLTKEYISDFLGAIGWGDIIIYSKENVYINHYPYTTLYNKTTYPIIRGMLSGFLTALYQEDIRLLKAEPYVDSNTFSLIITV